MTPNDTYNSLNFDYNQDQDIISKSGIDKLRFKYTH